LWSSFPYRGGAGLHCGWSRCPRPASVWREKRRDFSPRSSGIEISALHLFGKAQEDWGRGDRGPNTLVAAVGQSRFEAVHSSHPTHGDGMGAEQARAPGAAELGRRVEASPGPSSRAPWLRAPFLNSGDWNRAFMLCILDRDSNSAIRPKLADVFRNSGCPPGPNANHSGFLPNARSPEWRRLAENPGKHTTQKVKAARHAIRSVRATALVSYSIAV